MQKRIQKKYILIIAMIAIVVSLVAGVTLAFYHTDTESVENEFTPTRATCQVVETFDGTTKSDVAIRNSGDIQSYIRAKILVNWMTDDYSKVTARVPQEGVDYTIQYTQNTKWKLSSDGFWYYTMPIDAGEVTEQLIDVCKLLDTANVPDGFYLSVEIVATAIQSTPTKAVLEGWDSGVKGVEETTLKVK